MSTVFAVGSDPGLALVEAFPGAPDFLSHTIVYRGDSGRLGVDCDELGQLFVVDLVQDAWLVPLSLSGLVQFSMDTRQLIHLRTLTFPKGLVIHAGDADLIQEIDQLKHYWKAQNQQALREKYGQPSKPIIPPLLATMLGSTGRLRIEAMRFVWDHSLGVSAWHFSEYGLHATVSSRGTGLLQSIEFRCASHGLDFVSVASKSLLPAW